MMARWTLGDGRIVSDGEGFHYNGINYPGNWLALAGDADRQALGAVVASDPTPNLATVKVTLSAKVDADAEAVRLRYITPGDGMAMTYQEKHAQARAVLAMGQTAANALTEQQASDQFPTLSASVGLEANSLWDCATLVVQRYEQFADLSRIIERTRLQGKKSIGEASDVASARAAYEAIEWNLP